MNTFEQGLQKSFSNHCATWKNYFADEMMTEK